MTGAPKADGLLAHQSKGCMLSSEHVCIYIGSTIARTTESPLKQPCIRSCVTCKIQTCTHKKYTQVQLIYVVFLPQRKGRGTDSGCRRRAPRGSTTACMHRRSSATAVPHTSAHNISRKMNELNTRIIMIVMSNLARKTKFEQFAV